MQFRTIKTTFKGSQRKTFYRGGRDLFFPFTCRATPCPTAEEVEVSRSPTADWPVTEWLPEIGSAVREYLHKVVSRVRLYSIHLIIIDVEVSNRYTSAEAVRRSVYHFLQHQLLPRTKLIGLDPSWRTSTVLALADSIRSQQSFEQLPILGDALEEAGCTLPELLPHYRSEAEHGLNCWALDLILDHHQPA